MLLDQPCQRIFDEPFVERLATVIGPGSFAAKSMREMHQRRAAGEDVVLTEVHGRLLVMRRESLGCVGSTELVSQPVNAGRSEPSRNRAAAQASVSVATQLPQSEERREPESGKQGGLNSAEHAFVVARQALTLLLAGTAIVRRLGASCFAEPSGVGQSGDPGEELTS